MEKLPDEKITILLDALNYQYGEINNNDQFQQQTFQWLTSLLIAVFGAIVALSQFKVTIPYPITIKILLSIMVSLPTVLSIIWLFRRRKASAESAEAVDRIRDLLHLFDSKFYAGDKSPYPQKWQGGLAKRISKRKTVVYYSIVIALLLVSVLTTVWILI